MTKTILTVLACALLALGCQSGAVGGDASVDASAVDVSAAPHRIGMDYPSVGGDLTGSTNNAGIQSLSGAGGAGGNVTCNINSLAWAANQTPGISQATPGSVTTPSNFTLSTQAPNGGSGSAAQNTGGSFIVNVPVPGAVGTAGNEAYLEVSRGGTAVGYLGYANVNGGSLAIWGQYAPNANNAVMYASSAVTEFYGAQVEYNSGGSGQFWAIGGTPQMSLVSGELYSSTDTSMALGDATHRWSELYLSSGLSAGTSANGLSLTTSELSSTTNGTIALGDNTHAFSGLYAQLLGGSTTVPLAWAATAGAIACGTGGTQTVSAAQAATPGLTVTTGTLGSNCIVDFGTNAVTGWYVVDVTGVTLGAFNIQFKNGSQSETLAVLPTGGLVLVWTHGANHIVVN